MLCIFPQRDAAPFGRTTCLASAAAGSDGQRYRINALDIEEMRFMLSTGTAEGGIR
jgi:hypothetical protein